MHKVLVFIGLFMYILLSVLFLFISFVWFSFCIFLPRAVQLGSAHKHPSSLFLFKFFFELIVGEIGETLELSNFDKNNLSFIGEGAPESSSNQGS